MNDQRCRARFLFWTLALVSTLASRDLAVFAMPPQILWRKPVRAVSVLAFSPDGDLLATALGRRGKYPDGDRARIGQVQVRDARSGKRLRTIDACDCFVDAVAFSPDRRIMATAGGDGSTRLWRWKEGRLLRVLPPRRARLNAAQFSPDGKLLAIGDVDGGVRLYGVPGFRQLRSLKGASGGSLAFSPDSAFLASAGDGVRLWRASDGKPLLWLAHSGGPVDFSPGGTRIAVQGPDRSIELHDLTTGKKLRSFKGHTEWLRSLAFSPSGRILASYSQYPDDVVAYRRVADGTVLRTYERLEGPVAFSPDGAGFVFASGGEIVVARAPAGLR
jgi:WD40 repeat protein